jgi:hypothetical protein
MNTLLVGDRIVLTEPKPEGGCAKASPPLPAAAAAVWHQTRLTIDLLLPRALLPVRSHRFFRALCFSHPLAGCPRPPVDWPRQSVGIPHTLEDRVGIIFRPIRTFAVLAFHPRMGDRNRTYTDKARPIDRPSAFGLFRTQYESRCPKRVDLFRAGMISAGC